MFESSQSLTSSPGQKGKGKCCYSVIPARFVFVGLSFFGLILTYAYKVVLSVAIVSMVKKHNEVNNSTNATEQTPYDTCPASHSSSNKDDKAGNFDWDDHLQAIVLGAFFYGYIVTQLPAGVLSEKFGAKWIFGCSLLSAAIFSLLGPIAAKQSSTLFIITRIGQGLAEGVVFPCMNGMISRWMPKMERSRGATIIYSGSQIGTVLTLPIAGFLCDSDIMGGWPAPFYVLGIVGCIWFVFWAIFVFEDPDSHPFISQEEYDYIVSDQGIEKSSGKRTTPWKSILTSVPVYALIFSHFGQNWGFLTVLTLLPTYFEKVLKMDIKHNALWSSLPYLLQAVVAWIVSFISDKLRQKQILDITVIRKINNTIAFVGPAVCMSAVALVECNTTLSILFFVLAMGLNGFVYSGFNATHVDMAPDFAGTLMGITNSIGNIPGFVAPAVAAAFYNQGHTLTNWSYVFYLSAAVYVTAAVVYLVFATAQLQEWGISRNDETSKLNNEKKKIYSVNNAIVNNQNNL